MSRTILQDQLTCVDCGGTEFISDISRGDVVCRDCGTIAEKILVGSHFQDRTQGADIRTGSPESRRGHSTSFRVFEANTEHRDKYRRMYNTENSAYCAISENKSRILTILTRLGLSEHSRNDLMYELNNNIRVAKLQLKPSRISFSQYSFFIALYGKSYCASCRNHI